MFQNAFQSGSYLEVFDAKVNKEKDKFYEKLYKVHNPPGVNKVYDKQIKSYIYELEGGLRTKMQFPKEEKQELALIQQFLVFQIFLPAGTPFSIEVVITDTAKNKRRLNFTSAVNKIDKNYFHAKIPLDMVKRGVWLNLSLDLLSFFELFKGQTFRSIDSFCVGAVCKLKRIFTMKSPLAEFCEDEEFPASPTVKDTQLVPKTQNFLSGVNYVNQLLNYDAIARFCEDNAEIPEMISHDDINSSLAFNNSMKVKSLGTSVKEKANPMARNTTKQEDRSSNNRTKGELQVPFSADPEKKMLKANKENLETASKTLLWKKNNALRLGTGNRDGSVQLPQKTGSAKKPGNQRSLSPNHRVGDERFSRMNKRNDSIEADEEEKHLRGSIRLSSVEKEETRGMSHDQAFSKYGKNGSSNKNPFKSPGPDVNNTNSKSKLDGKKALGNPWNESVDVLESRGTGIKKKPSKPQLNAKEVIINNFQSPPNRDMRDHLKRMEKMDNTATFESRKKSIEGRETSNLKVPPQSSGTAGKSPTKQGPLSSGKHPSRNVQSGNRNKATKGAYMFDEEEVKLESTSKFNNAATLTNVQSVMNTSKDNAPLQLKKPVKSANPASKNIKKPVPRDITKQPSGRHFTQPDANTIQMNDDIESIEENLEYEINSMNGSGKIDRRKMEEYGYEKRDAVARFGNTKRSISEINNLPQHNDDYNSGPGSRREGFPEDLKVMEGTIEDFTDSLDDNQPYVAHGRGGTHAKVTPKGLSANYFSNKDKDKNDNVDRKKSVYEEQFNNMVNKVRPFSPPFSSTQIATGGDRVTMITKKNNETVVINNNDTASTNLTEESKKAGNGLGLHANGTGKEPDNLLEVIYDPVLNCYYHPKTNSYYELKE
jgi:hypothetical protein